MTLKIGSLFTGYGGLDQAVSQVTGAETVWVCDGDKGVNKILAHRYPNIPNHGDITTTDFGTVEPVDILTGGFPCQDISHAGKGAGLKDGTRSGLWSHMERAVKELNPRLVVVENVRGLLSADAPSDVEPCPWCVGDRSSVNLRPLGVVLADLADLGYDTQWCGLRAADVGACHGRFRVFLIAHPQDTERSRPQGPKTTTGTLHPWATVRPHGSDRNSGKGLDAAGLTLLPTPAANDMGVNKTLEWWDNWTEELRQKFDNSNGHGPSLGIEAQKHKDGWGQYTPAISRWETLLGRSAPEPTEIVKNEPRLSARFVEWMMGLPEGWVSDVPGITRNESLKALGNGVVPQQAAAALRHMLEEA